MTKHRNQKRIVRARMAKTGESYQSAHRAVTAPAESSGPREARVGDVVAGRYRLLRLVPHLATGEAAPPWQTFDAKHVLLGSDVALRILPRARGLAEPALRTSMFREARVLQHVAHPQVVRVYDIGETEAEELYLVLERAPLATLATHLDADPVRAPMDVRVVRDVFEQLAGLHAHFEAKGIAAYRIDPGFVHLDEREGGKLEVKIASLGFARLPGDPPLGAAGRGDATTGVVALGLLLRAMLGSGEARGNEGEEEGSARTSLEETCRRLLRGESDAARR